MRLHIIKIIIIILLSVTGQAKAQVLTDDECAQIIKTFKIDPKIKSSRGWKNVFKSEKWLKQFKLTEYTPEELECIKSYILANAMNVGSHKQYLGMEIKL